MNILVLATMNPKKLTELLTMAPDGINLVCLKDIPEANGIEQVDENGTTFLENAQIKAKYWSNILNLPVLAEDSGIMYDALGRFPGVYTKRYIKKYFPKMNPDVDRPDLLYPQLYDEADKSGNPSKTAKWVTAMVIKFPDGREFTQVCETCGKILKSPRGERVFGFDQFFIPDGDERTLSEMSINEKNSFSPRYNAFNSIISQLKNKSF